MLPLSTPRDDFVLLVPPLLLILGGPRCTFISVPYSILILLLSPPNGILYRVLTPSTNFAPDFKRGGGGGGGGGGWICGAGGRIGARHAFAWPSRSTSLAFDYGRGFGA